MNFNLSNAGSGIKTARVRTVKANWHEGQAILETTEDNFILSHTLCEKLNIANNAICTLFFDEGAVFLANVTGKELADKNVLKITNVKLGDFKNARTARRKELLTLWTANGHTNGLFTINENFEKPEGVDFDLVELIPYIVASEEVELDNDEIDGTEELVTVEENEITSNEIPEIEENGTF